MHSFKCKNSQAAFGESGPVRIERRRTLRIKLSGLQKDDLQDLDRPAINFAENRDELQQSFALVYQVYLQKKFITEPKPHGMLYNIYSLLPETVNIMAKFYLTVMSNLSIIPDTQQFGLPMDVSVCKVDNNAFISYTFAE